jgi:hypothetical protein
VLKYSSEPFYQEMPQRDGTVAVQQKVKIDALASVEFSKISLVDARRLGIAPWSKKRYIPSSQIGSNVLVSDKRRVYFLQYEDFPQRNKELYERLNVMRQYKKLDDLPAGYSIELAILDTGERAVRLKKPDGKTKKPFIFIPKALD